MERKDRLIRLLLVILIMFLIMRIALRVNAQEEPKMVKYRMTVYCDSGVTKSGQYTRDGIVAMNNEMLGKSVALYRYNLDGSVGEFIGWYEVLDTGSNAELKAGKRIDVYKESIDLCWDWIAEYGDYVYAIIYDAVG